MKAKPKPAISAAGLKPVIFLKEVKAELDKVDWPSRQQAVKLTSIVIGVSVFTSLFLGAFDFIFTKLMEAILK